jgi:hypothetical protein
VARLVGGLTEYRIQKRTQLANFSGIDITISQLACLIYALPIAGENARFFCNPASLVPLFLWCFDDVIILKSFRAILGAEAVDVFLTWTDVPPPGSSPSGPALLFDTRVTVWRQSRYYWRMRSLSGIVPIRIRATARP